MDLRIQQQIHGFLATCALWNLASLLDEEWIYNDILKEAMADDLKKPEAERVIAVLLKALDGLERTRGAARTNGVANLGALREGLVEKVGDVLTDKFVASQRTAVAQVIMETNVSL